MNRTIAVADIGGTHARFALAEVGGGRLVSLGRPVTLRTVDHASVEEAWQAFGRQAGIRLPDAVAIAVAGPTGGEQLKLTNNPWVIRPALIPVGLGVEQYLLVNDFGAIAHAIAQFGPEYFDHLCGPEGPMPGDGVTTIIGPGTGLGVAQLLRTGDRYEVIESEGGHVAFAPLDELEDRILAILRSRHPRVSVERVAAGPGLANLYHAIAEIEGKTARDVDDRAIWAAAMDHSDPLASRALDRFFLALGATAGDLALAHGAKAVVIAGGLGYRLKDRFEASGFASRFVAKGRFEGRMRSIPVKLVNHPQAGLCGAAAAFAREFS